RAEADAGHGLSLTLRQAAYVWFDKWLAGRTEAPREAEIPVTPRTTKELLVCAGGQVNVTFHSKPLLAMVVEEFRRKKKPPPVTLKELLGGKVGRPDFHLTKTGALGRANMPQVVCINGVEDSEWQADSAFLAALGERGIGVTILDLRGTGKLKPAGLESLNSV